MVEVKDKPIINQSKTPLTSAQKRPLLLSILTALVGTTVGIIATLALLEGIFALAHVGEDTEARPDPLLGYAQMENQTITFRFEGYSRSTISSQGFRDHLYAVPKPAGTQRVCIVGDSMTMGLEVPLNCTFPKVLERRLQADGKNIEVVNCGMSGTGTGQQYLGYRKLIAPLQPDMLIVAYHLGDTDDNVGGGTNPPRPTFLLADGKNLQVDFRDVDKWLAGLDARFYSSCDYLRRNSRVLAVLNKLDLDLHMDPTYKTITRIVGKPVGFVWSKILKALPVGDWHVNAERSVAADLMPSVDPKVLNNSAAISTATTIPSEKPAVDNKSAATGSNKSAATGSNNAATGSNSAAATMAQVLARPENGDLNAYRGLLFAHFNRMLVTKEIFKRWNQDCQKNHCKLVIAALPAYDNSIMYYREVNELRQFAKENHLEFVDSVPYFPARGPMDESPYHFAMHFNRAGHARMSELLYQDMFRTRNPF